jgi:REP element-mobilizing transposase RayT
MPVLAYFITVTTYGTWLHGDDRGSVDRKADSLSRHKLEPDPALVEQMRARMKHPPITLDAAMRECVNEAILEHCEFRGWQVLALNVRSNHFHLVVSAPGVSKSKVLNSVKARATRRLRESNLLRDRPVWTERGSKTVLETADELEAARNYTLFRQ